VKIDFQRLAQAGWIILVITEEAMNPSAVVAVEMTVSPSRLASS
jgi:hypothetical protein